MAGIIIILSLLHNLSISFVICSNIYAASTIYWICNVLYRTTNFIMKTHVTNEINQI